MKEYALNRILQPQFQRPWQAMIRLALINGARFGHIKSDQRIFTAYGGPIRVYRGAGAGDCKIMRRASS